jgi:hypothetical protein
MLTGRSSEICANRETHENAHEIQAPTDKWNLRAPPPKDPERVLRGCVSAQAVLDPETVADRDLDELM